MSDVSVAAATGQKVCRCCGLTKPEADFYARRAVCKPCTAERKRVARAAWTPEQKERRRETRRATLRKYRGRKRELIQSFKDRPCIDCGQEFHPAAMDLHHRDPSEKEFAVSRMIYRTEEEIAAEAAKCDVICANCHRVRHALEERDAA